MRRVNKKVLTAAVSTCLAIGAVAAPAAAVLAQSINITEKSSIVLSNGTYTVDAKILKKTSDDVSSAASYFTNDGAKLVVKNGTAKLQLRYSSTMIGGLAQIVDGSNQTLDVVKDGSENYVELTFESLSETVALYMEINTNSLIGTLKQEVRVLLDESTIKKDGVTVAPTPEVTAVPTATPTIAPTATPTIAPTQSPEEEAAIKDGLYETNVYLWHASKDQASMAASALNGTARIVVKDGTGVIYIYTKQMTMGTITAYLQELKVATATGTYKDAKVETKDAEGNPTCFSFTLPSFEEYVTIKVNPHVAMMGNQDIDARLKIDYTSLKEVKEDHITEAPEETKAPGNATATPAVSPAVSKSPVSTANPSSPSATEEAETKEDNTEHSFDGTAGTGGNAGTTGGSSWSEASGTSEGSEESEEAEEEEAEEGQEETEDEEEAEQEALPQTGEALVSTAKEQSKTASEEDENHTPLVATAAASASCFLTSLLWTVKLRFLKR